MKLSAITVLLCGSLASAGWIELKTASGRSTNTGDANKGCLGPVAGRGPYKLIAHDFKPKSLKIYAGANCKGEVLNSCTGCTSLTAGNAKRRGAVWGWFS
ncbi:predicted protein [Uncinocarpus reesii 1704]|uniref:Pectate lyase n=1 Tax=Uncinocarpus reesii (strain UAMH 1704) TaxID=336963 RepID=C4JSI8_UNCRE|nr:uncharacterized protein UREG_05427 [Uncinocarpus reesii 1704]EEP80585.1 predicted protein [Uncinocarpus reesii 1704]